MQDILKKYADLLVHYCVSLQPGEKLYVHSTTAAEPLVREVYRAALRAGGIVEVDLAFRGRGRIFLEEADGAQLDHVNTLYDRAVREFDAYLYIRAPFNLFEDAGAGNAERQQRRKAALRDAQQIYFARTGTRDLKRNLCQFPTQAAAQNADMSLDAYEQFVFGACKLFEDDPKAAWQALSQRQQGIVDELNKHESFRYASEQIDISFSTKGRTWINSDGQTNMPSGEVYTSPVEDSVNGHIHFDYPSVYQGHEVEGVTLYVKDGYIERWEAKRGKDFLDQIFAMDGARRFGEAAIGTNYDIDRFTKNILFDEKIGGTVHMAIGQSYRQCGGRNESAVHWDMIADMTRGGVVYADGAAVYESGKFLVG